MIFMNHGRIVDVDTPEGLAKKLKKTRLRLMMRDGQKRTIDYCRKKKLPVTANERFLTIELDETKIASILHDLAGIGVDYSEISVEKPSLEDYFIEEAREH